MWKVWNGFLKRIYNKIGFLLLSVNWEKNSLTKRKKYNNKKTGTLNLMKDEY